MTQLFVGCSSSDAWPFAALFAEVARRTIPAPYVLHGHPATHAFVVVEGGGLWWRLDGQFPVATWGPWWQPKDPTRIALWRINGPDDVINQGIHRARQLDRTPFDLVELGAQLARCLAKGTWIPGAQICTTLVCDVLTACNAVPEGIVNALVDRQPERLCQALHAHENDYWLRREL